MFGAAASENEARYAVRGSGLRAAGSVLYWLEDGCEADLPRCARALPTCEPDDAALDETSFTVKTLRQPRGCSENWSAYQNLAKTSAREDAKIA